MASEGVCSFGFKLRKRKKGEIRQAAAAEGRRTEGRGGAKELLNKNK